jgi:hypothetical protein
VRLQFAVLIDGDNADAAKLDIATITVPHFQMVSSALCLFLAGIVSDDQVSILISHSVLSYFAARGPIVNKRNVQLMI